MFDRLAALAHLLRMLVEPALNGFEAVGDGIELLHAQRRLGLVGHMGELRSVGSVVGYLMHDDQMMAVGLWRRVPLNARLLVDELSKNPF